jgi:hypothetical protein
MSIDYKKDFFEHRQTFINNFHDMISDLISKNRILRFSLKKHISKVSFVPIHNKNGSAFVTLGKHVRGKRRKQFNFFGGGSNCELEIWEKKNDIERMNVISSTLFDEVYEEFGIVLNIDCLAKSLLDVKRAGNFLLFYVNIYNINKEDWNTMQNNRKNIENIERKYTEILELDDFDLNYIQSEYDRLKDPETGKILFYVENENITVSRYVISMSKHLKDMSVKLSKYTELGNFGTDIKEYKDIPLASIL